MLGGDGVGAVGYGDLLGRATSPDLMLAPAVESPIVRRCQALKWLVCHGGGML